MEGVHARVGGEQLRHLRRAGRRVEALQEAGAPPARRGRCGLAAVIVFVVFIIIVVVAIIVSIITIAITINITSTVNILTRILLNYCHDYHFIVRAQGRTPLASLRAAAARDSRAGPRGGRAGGPAVTEPRAAAPLGSSLGNAGRPADADAGLESG